ncbi:hypothetical protein H6P81_019047 [Aristolochia fimbriata]|uniref:Pectinesterase inhibitor domain-containing protein n=1 Tax=Aristolochia fimbriata TaxID=158543 RepID=A0AAV7E7D9_ARIFI|nr:hypothetical protein H6P81_019047 [Aristolochia fimbriata]
MAATGPTSVMVALLFLISDASYRELCKHSTYPDICFSILSSNPQSKGKNFIDLTDIVITYTLKKTDETRGYISGLLTSEKDTIVMKTASSMASQMAKSLSPPVRENLLKKSNDDNFKYCNVALELVNFIDEIVPKS